VANAPVLAEETGTDGATTVGTGTIDADAAGAVGGADKGTAGVAMGATGADGGAAGALASRVRYVGVGDGNAV
jgi:hypothetical protein